MFRRCIFYLILWLSAFLFCDCSHQKETSKDSLPNKVILTNVAIVDVENGGIQDDKTIVIEGNKINQIIDGSVDTSNARLIDGRGKYLIPGLWDMHVHFTAMPENLKLFIAHGVTGVRDMGGILLEERADTLVFLPQQVMLDSILTVRRLLDEGKLIGPRIVAAGLTLNGPLPEAVPVIAPFQKVVTDGTAAKLAVQELVERNVDFIKVHALLSKEAYYAIAKEAKRLNTPFAGHLPNVLTPIEASNAGQSSIEHLTGIPEYIKGYENEPKDSLSVQRRAEEVYSLFKKNNTWQTPTLTSYLGYEMAPKLYHDKATDERLQYVAANIQQFWQYYWPPDMFNEEGDGSFFKMLLEATADLHQAGVGILAGTDFAGPFVYPGFSLHDELRLLHQAGMSNLSTLQTATLNPAKFLGITSLFGTVEEGKVADLVLLDGSPLEDINNTRKIHAVISNGKVFTIGDIEKLLKEGKALVDE